MVRFTVALPLGQRVERAEHGVEIAFADLEPRHVLGDLRRVELRPVELDALRERGAADEDQNESEIEPTHDAQVYHTCTHFLGAIPISDAASRRCRETLGRCQM